ncbi:hypothetical protein SU69_07305 [Thermosipho melanesiensis]|uniref:Cell wall hydrolase SleB domain-containing protein n=2 Tax=Thermosipho melanesiensis TaxID=46541 RepID=A6LMY5_THEM4|nr:cell wall hydrolase [Thermosipho melanesiensis]ABR31286.1 hypothetical protein Tmel_1439 [Thermosipho melanesiensis BI429]APT74904.1 hypothetical protein BW47_07630 [Thermosipho melanesiensis]OOC36309.1 hypothetical protein SU68_07375 [Thermosipho melanesiensis]OOC37127.1 hypothetical protein SU69_07305 [Thermosipho melanesiensis]OOC37879.1 hypothetical protein SU70_07315 [Thermosipho melanesiensis]
MTYDIGKAALVVMGEAEGQSFEEKKWIAHVILNRLKHGKFRPIEKDFIGYRRAIDIDEELEREAMTDAVNAAVLAFYEHLVGIDPTKGATFFATKKYIKEKDPNEIFGVKVEPVPTPNYFAHQFYRLVTPSK